MLDGIQLERRGVPAAVICTEEFEVTARATAAQWGFADYDMALIAHPIANLSAEGLQRRAQQALPAVRRSLQLGRA
ncbi:MAG: hypothetical protein HYY96_06585 [Candidatus Tectomicrobia bacterium]|nr:hypothetical protein [Candidatus Tectomicrobia bacterium]